MAGKKGTKRRTNDEIAAVREAAREELSRNFPMSLRQVHYRLTSRDDVVQPNTRSAYQVLGGWLRDDRLSDEVPWEWMEDRLRNPVIWQAWRDPSEFLLDKLHELSHGYHRDPWQDQPSYVEVWCEKDALSGIFKSVLSEYYVTLRIGRGYDSWSSIKEAADEYTRRLKRHGQETTVLLLRGLRPFGRGHAPLADRALRDARRLSRGPEGSAHPRGHAAAPGQLHQGRR